MSGSSATTGGTPPAGTFYDLQAARRLSAIGNVVLVGSGKGGVGKSLVACGLAIGLSRRGLRVGVLDVDVHGATVTDYLRIRPPVRSTALGLEPKRGGRVKAMSVALFTGNNPVPLSGGQKQSVIVQLFAQTNWGSLDYLVVDMPPSTGDELRSVLRLFGPKSVMVLVTTPSPRAIGVVSRLRSLADSERVPVLGVVINMAYLETGGARAFPFGRQRRETVARSLRAPVIAEIPLDHRLNSEPLSKVLAGRNGVSRAFSDMVGIVGAGSASRR
ncbi:MAG: P-loop NTPase [Nitrososphaerales archaeon]|jgi:ATP-binding protein involved in chromosome partitioning